jgi:hypothetical protein
VTGRIEISGSVETTTPERFEEKRNAAEKDEKARDKLRLGVEIAGLVFIIIYAGLTALMYCANKEAADAAKSAANTAKDALHISERAYVVTGHPTIDTDTKIVTLPIINSGHIPSGNVNAIIHQAALSISTPDGSPKRVFGTGACWKHFEMESVPTVGQTMSFNLRVPSLSVADLGSGHQQIVIVGTIMYNDGFSDDPDQPSLFCYGYGLLPPSNGLEWPLCDPNLYLRDAIAADHYPQNECK